ncbi:MAG: hypothetical protein K2P70_02145 [Hyphomonadaceae bacterium]|nr:hypothetical protein [Hyphomonadaceae bacterium]
MLETLGRVWAWLGDTLGWSPFLPDSVKAAWRVYFALLLVGLLGLTAVSVYFRYGDPRRFGVEQTLAVATAVDRLRRQNFAEEWRSADNLSVLMAQPIRRETTSLLQQTKVFVRPDGQIHFNVMIPFEDAYWRESSTSRFQRDNGSPVALNTLFRQTEYQRAFLASRNLICVGLASRSPGDASPATDENNEQLSEVRSRNLCRLVAGALGRNAPTRYHQLALGYYAGTPPQDGSLAHKRQRSAVIIGVTAVPDRDYSDELVQVIMSTALSNVDLAAYSQSSSPQIVEFEPDWESRSRIEDDPRFQDTE